MKVSELIGPEVLGHNVIVMDELRDTYPDRFNESGGMDYRWFEHVVRPFNHIYIRNDVKSISVTLSPDLFSMPSSIFREIANRLQAGGY